MFYRCAGPPEFRFRLYVLARYGRLVVIPDNCSTVERAEAQLEAAMQQPLRQIYIFCKYARYRDANAPLDCD